MNKINEEIHIVCRIDTVTTSQLETDSRCVQYLKELKVIYNGIFHHEIYLSYSSQELEKNKAEMMTSFTSQVMAMEV